MTAIKSMITRVQKVSAAMVDFILRLRLYLAVEYLR